MAYFWIVSTPAVATMPSREPRSEGDILTPQATRFLQGKNV